MELNSVRIPGKVMLSGEYAVLYGATALLVPVPRYLTLTESLEPLPNPSPVLECALAEPIGEIAAWEEKYPLVGVEVDREEFYLGEGAGRIKLGLGSSAAEAVGVVALRLERAGIPWRDNRNVVAKLAEKAHNKAQGGIGSGADVVAVALDQPLRFRRTNDGFEVTPLAQAHLPKLTLLHSGVAADTRDMVRTFSAWVEQSPTHRVTLGELVELSNTLADAWRGGDQSRLFELLDAFNSLMERVTAEAGIPWKTKLHKEIEEWAKVRGGRAKPTGAGAGDLILLIGELPLNQRSEPRINLT